jgi:predicted DNA-binding transcriptional regulator YafY
MPKHYFERLEYLDYLIQKRSTGSPAQVAKSLNISIRTAHLYIDILKALGAEIYYCRTSETYYYREEGEFNFKFKKKLKDIV